MSPVSLSEIAEFLNLLFNGFENIIFLSFVLMIGSAITIFIKYLLSGVR
jgi:hypothetical protein